MHRVKCHALKKFVSRTLPLLGREKYDFKPVKENGGINLTKRIVVCFLGALCAECRVSNVNITLFFILPSLSMAVYGPVSVLCRQTALRGDKGCIFQSNEILPLLADASFVLLFRIQQRAYKVKDSLSALSAKPLLLVHNV